MFAAWIMFHLSSLIVLGCVCVCYPLHRFLCRYLCLELINFNIHIPKISVQLMILMLGVRCSALSNVQLPPQTIALSNGFALSSNWSDHSEQKQKKLMCYNAREATRCMCICGTILSVKDQIHETPIKNEDFEGNKINRNWAQNIRFNHVFFSSFLYRMAS